MRDFNDKNPSKDVKAPTSFEESNMLKLTLAAALSIGALTIAPLSLTTGSALAQRLPCTAGPNCPGGSTESTAHCSDELGYLRRVYEEELDVIDDSDLVSVVPICIHESYGVFRADGNAGALRSVIADNDAMLEALLDKDFLPDDVVGVRMTGPQTVILYVFPFF